MPLLLARASPIVHPLTRTACVPCPALSLQPGRCRLPADLHPLVNSGLAYLANSMFAEAVGPLAAAQLQLPADPLVWLLQVETQLKLQNVFWTWALISHGFDLT